MDRRWEEVADIIDQCKLTAIRYEEQDIYLKCCNPRTERECPGASSSLPPGVVIDVYQYKYQCYWSAVARYEATNELQDAILDPRFDLWRKTEHISTYQHDRLIYIVIWLTKENLFQISSRFT